MSDPQGMRALDARLASFDSVRPKGKKRTSNAKSKKTAEFTWSFQAPSIDQLAQAGFYYTPTIESSDNVTCFHCNSSLNHWEEGDDAFAEHLANIPDCAWAIVSAVEKAVIKPDEKHDPLSEQFLNARKETFGSSWPHEKKRGWTPRVAKLAEAGWHYFPSSESEDYTKCAYCNLCLDGWEPKDKPIDEHKRRSPDCAFFSLADMHKKTRRKTSRASKASRVSTQSAFTTTQDDTGGFDNSAQADDSILTTATDLTTASAATSATGGGKAKKGTGRSRAGSRAKKAGKTDVVTEVVESIIEDSVMDVDPPVQPKRARGKKRSTADMQAGEPEDVAAPPKKRATRARASTASNMDPDHDMAKDASTIEPEPEEIAVPKRGAKKRGAARTSSRTASETRKASSRTTSAKSTASTAPLRQQVLDDGQIEAMLEADLDRPNSDEEMPDVRSEEAEAEQEPAPEPKPKAKRQTRAKGTKAAASKAPLRKTSKISAPVEIEEAREPSPVAPLDDSMISNEDSVVAAKSQTHTMFAKSYQDQDGPDSDVEAELAQMAAEESKAQGKGKKLTRKASNATTKGKKGKAGKKQTAQQENIEAEPGLEAETELDIHVDEPEPKVTNGPGAHVEPNELRFSSSFENEPSVLEEVEVSPELVQHYSPQKKTTTSKPSRMPRVTKNPTSTKPAKKEQAAKATSARAQPSRVVDEVAIEPDLVQGATREPSPSPMRPAAQRVSASRLRSPEQAAPGAFPSPTPSPQSSNAENEPPSSRPSQQRPPLAPLTSCQLKTTVTRIPLAAEATTPTKSIRKDRADGSVSPEWALKSTFPWRPIDIETVFLGSPSSKGKWFDSGKENFDLSKASTKHVHSLLTSPEKKMTVEEWIKHNAEKGEEKLKAACERAVGQFESQGVTALKVLEGLEVQE